MSSRKSNELRPVAEKCAKRPFSDRPIGEDCDVTCDANGRPVEFDARPGMQVLVEIDQMHESDVINLRKRVQGGMSRIRAAGEELEATRYGRFDPPAVLALLDGVIRAAQQAKSLLIRTA